MRSARKVRLPKHAGLKWALVKELGLTYQSIYSTVYIEIGNLTKTLEHVLYL